MWKFLLESKYRDCKNITIWCDNCAGQNKNWTLYSSIIQSLSTSEVLVETITLKYFEKGHTFIAADSFQHQVEEGIRKRCYLYDFNDYIQVVNLCGNAIEMSHEDFYDFINYKSNGKELNYPLIADISVVRCQKKILEFIGKIHLKNQNLNQVSFYKRNSVTFEEKSDCQERNGLREVSTRERKMIF